MTVYKENLDNKIKDDLVGRNLNWDDYKTHKAEKAKYARFNITANQSIPNGQNTQIIWNTKTSFKGEDFCEIDSVTRQVKVLKTGLYQIQVGVEFGGSNVGQRVLYNQLLLQTTYPNTTAPCYVTMQEFVYLNANALYECRVMQSSGGALDVRTNVTALYIRRVI